MIRCNFWSLPERTYLICFIITQWQFLKVFIFCCTIIKNHKEFRCEKRFLNQGKILVLNYILPFRRGKNLDNTCKIQSEMSWFWNTVRDTMSQSDWSKQFHYFSRVVGKLAALMDPLLNKMKLWYFLNESITIYMYIYL